MIQLLSATTVAIAGSVVVDALLVEAGTLAFPDTSNFDHYRFSHYATLTTIGVVVACGA